MALTALSVLGLACLWMLLLPSQAYSTECQALADHYLEKHHKEAAPYTGSNLVYFLHVPRTAGRTFHSCLLKTGTPPRRRCPKAYDHLRINFTVPDCGLLSSHDDFSVVSMLPEDTAVLSQVRDPVDRFLSAYEFAIEVGSRALNRPKNFRKRPGKIATEDVWPWSYLVPWFIDDMRPRVSHELLLLLLLLLGRPCFQVPPAGTNVVCLFMRVSSCARVMNDLSCPPLKLAGNASKCPW